MSRRTAAVEDPELETTGGIEFEVDEHQGVPLAAVEPGDGEAQPDELEQLTAGAVLNWTPEEAGQFFCSLFNIGMLLYGPEWAAHPQETAGWNIYLAQLLDQVLPKGMGGAAELGVGLIMVGNGLAMMALRRWPLIQRGPRPMWAKPPQAQDAAQAAAVAVEAPVEATGETGRFRFKEGELPAQPRDDSMVGLGL